MRCGVIVVHKRGYKRGVLWADKGELLRSMFKSKGAQLSEAHVSGLNSPNLDCNCVAASCTAWSADVGYMPHTTL